MFDLNDADNHPFKKATKETSPMQPKPFLRQPSQTEKTVDAILAKASEEKPCSPPPGKNWRNPTPIRHTLVHANNDVLPALPCAKTLKTLEPPISVFFRRLKDRYDEPLIYQLFNHLSTDKMR